MCVLALNIINEKIYVMLWFWLIILAVMTSLYMVSYSFNAYIIWGKWKKYLLNDLDVGFLNRHFMLPTQTIDLYEKWRFFTKF
jgi:hypothetical protein